MTALFDVAFLLHSPNRLDITTHAHGLTGFQPNAGDRQEKNSSAGAEFFPECKYSINASAGFQPSVDTGFQPKEGSVFEPAAPKRKRKYQPIAVKSISRRAAWPPEKHARSIQSIQRNFMGEAVAGKASSAAAGWSPEANGAKNSGAGFQASVDIGFPPKERSLCEQAARIKERNRIASQRRMKIPEVREMKCIVEQQRYQRPEVKERRRLSNQRYNARPEVKEWRRIRGQILRAAQRGKELKHLSNKRYRADPRKQKMEQLRRKRYLATPSAKELKRLTDHLYYERKKHVPKFPRSGQEPGKKIRIKASSQEIDRKPSSKHHDS